MEMTAMSTKDEMPTARAMERRDFVRMMCWGGIATFGAPVARFAHVPGAGRLVFVLLRGGFDGLAAVVPIGDPAYAATRGNMAFAQADLTPLSGEFALAPGLAPLRRFWDEGQLVALHALAIPYRTRSHFDGQAILETGLASPDGASDGWLNRLLQVMEGRRSGLAISAGMPRSMVGSHPVSTWSPAQLGAVNDGYLDRLHLLYRSDRVLLGSFEKALSQRETTGDMAGAAPRPRQGGFAATFKAAARLLTAEGGPNVAAMEFSGWDTHANQGLANGPLDRLLGQLAEGLTAFRADLDSEWENTTVIIMTEFGRTARPNGTRGTDHGTAGAGFVIGPRVARSAVVSDWPGLGASQLFEGRDLRPTLDTRSVLKAAIAGTLDLTVAQADRVFPDSAAARSLAGLMG
jgi:uncharacterized protein (DUF1501 family)